MRQRVASLDGLRGIAAMVVLIRHAFNAIDMPIARQHDFLASPLALLLNAQGAVQLFFVLSGFVLAASVARDEKAAALAGFAVRRVFRIYPPYILALLFAFGASFFYADMTTASGASRWLIHFLDVRVEAGALFGHMLFPGQAGGLLDVGWTLQIELVVSLMLPFMLIAAQRTHWSVLLIFLAPLGLGDSWRMAWYVFDFVLGIVIFLERERLCAFVSTLPRLGATLFSMAALALFVAPMFATSPAVLVGRLAPGYHALDIVAMGLGSAGLIVASMALPTLARALCTRPIAFLGRVSFSLYLLHKTILHLLVPVLAPLDGAYAIVLLYVALISTSLVAASLGHRFVEKPTIALGRWAGQAAGRLVSFRADGMK